MIFAILSFMLGASFASFAGVIAYRLPKGISLIKPDSFCPYCKKSIKFLETCACEIPIAPAISF